MRKNDYFRLNIRKARIIKRIQFVNPDIGYPLKYGLEISEDGIKPFQKIKEYSGVIDILLNPPIRLQELRITIVDPKLEPMDENGCTPSWSIYSIHLFQPRWFNKWGSKEVKSG